MREAKEYIEMSNGLTRLKNERWQVCGNLLNCSLLLSALIPGAQQVRTCHIWSVCAFHRSFPLHLLSHAACKSITALTLFSHSRFSACHVCAVLQHFLYQCNKTGKEAEAKQAEAQQKLDEHSAQQKETEKELKRLKNDFEKYGVGRERACDCQQQCRVSQNSPSPPYPAPSFRKAKIAVLRGCLCAHNGLDASGKVSLRSTYTS